MTDQSLVSSATGVEHWRGQPGVWQGKGRCLIIGQPSVWSAGGRLIIVVCLL